MKREIRSRIADAGRRAGKLQNVWKSKVYHLDTKVTLYYSLVVSVLLYGCETWVVLKSDWHALEAFHYRMLSRMFRRQYDQHIKTEDLLKSCNCRSLKIIIAWRALKYWRKLQDGHNKAGNIVNSWTPKRKKQEGAQRKSWQDQISEHANTVNISLEELLKTDLKNWHKTQP